MQIEQTSKWYKKGMLFSVAWAVLGFVLGAFVNSPMLGIFFVASGLLFLLIFAVMAWWDHG